MSTKQKSARTIGQQPPLRNAVPIGAYRLALDGNGQRFVMPAALRASLGNINTNGSANFIITRRAPRILALIAANHWPDYLCNFADELRLTKAYSEKCFQFNFCDPARRVKMDKRGRLEIPAALFNYLGPDKGFCTVIIRAHSQWLEIIPDDLYENQRAAAQAELERLRLCAPPTTARSIPTDPVVKTANAADTAPS